MTQSFSSEVTVTQNRAVLQQGQGHRRATEGQGNRRGGAGLATNWREPSRRSIHVTGEEERIGGRGVEGRMGGRGGIGEINGRGARESSS
ncbi:hypothetical protein ACOMHN_052793 [Nucella lapillus]